MTNPEELKPIKEAFEPTKKPRFTPEELELNRRYMEVQNLMIMKREHERKNSLVSLEKVVKMHDEEADKEVERIMKEYKKV